MATIEVGVSSNPNIYRTVKLEGRTVGMIQRDKFGFYYKPKGSRTRGVTFVTFAALMDSLTEGEVSDAQ